MNTTAVMFWMLFTLSIYSYVLYPILLLAITRIRDRVRDAEDHDRVGCDSGSDALSVSLIVTAFNEESRIRQKISNMLQLRSQRLEQIVASDGSTDGTDQIVQEYGREGIQLVRAEGRRGKEYAQLCAIERSRGDVIVFSDVATRMDPEAISRLLPYFSDSAVGAVSSEDRFLSRTGAIVGEGLYVKYEMWLRRMEAGLGGLVGLSGSFFAVRRSLCSMWDTGSPSDFNTAISCARSGYRAITASDVYGYYQDIKDPSLEYQRKVRTMLRGITGLARHPEVLNPFRYGVFAWQIWSHKVMRWMVPWLLFALLLASIAAASNKAMYMVPLALQIVFYATAFAAHVSPRIRGLAVPRIIYFFTQSNLAAAEALIRWLFGRRMITWEPSAR